MEHLSHDRKDHLNQHKNSNKQCDETEHPVVNLMESQWKLRQQLDQNFLMAGKTIAEQIVASEERNKSKRAGLGESQSGIRVGKLTIWVSSFEIEKL